MKNFLAFVLIGTVLFTSSAQSAKPVAVIPPDKQAVEVSLTGSAKAADLAVYRKLRRLIGNAVAGGIADKFVVLGYGQETGFSACIENSLAANTTTKAFKKFVRQLQALKPNPQTAVYSVNWLDNCTTATAPVTEKPKTVFVAKSDGGLQCQDNGISLTEMQQQLTDIKVYSASKEHDGLMHITLCGSDAGNYNVYEIAETDLNAALALGFKAWTVTEN